MFSVVIPAHDEEAVIERCLRRLTERAVRGGIEIVVVCNGCRDGTAVLARQFGEPVKVLEVSRASKTAALNIGDAAATCFPRIYLDADVEVELDVIEAIAAVLDTPEPLAAAPRLKADVSRSSWLVRCFYKVWLLQPYHRSGMIGSGFYGLSRAGRLRLGPFPEIIADDEWVRCQFPASKRLNPGGLEFTIHAPLGLISLIKIKTRSRLGRLEIDHRFPGLSKGAGRQGGSRWRGLIMASRLFPASLVYLFVVLVTRSRARRQFRSLTSYEWESDRSSR